MGSFNGLNDSQEERLQLLAEEASEVIHAITKTLRHGYDSQHPLNRETWIKNRDTLAVEIGHFLFAMELMIAAEDIGTDDMARSMHAKNESVWKWLHHNSQHRGKLVLPDRTW